MRYIVSSLLAVIFAVTFFRLPDDRAGVEIFDNDFERYWNSRYKIDPCGFLLKRDALFYIGRAGGAGIGAYSLEKSAEEEIPRMALAFNEYRKLTFRAFIRPIFLMPFVDDWSHSFPEYEVNPTYILNTVIDANLYSTCLAVNPDMTGSISTLDIREKVYNQSRQDFKIDMYYGLIFNATHGTFSGADQINMMLEDHRDMFLRRASDLRSARAMYHEMSR